MVVVGRLLECSSPSDQVEHLMAGDKLKDEDAKLAHVHALIRGQAKNSLWTSQVSRCERLLGWMSFVIR